MTFTIPVWLLWGLGIIGGLVVLGLAVVGVWCLKFFSGTDWKLPL